MTYLTIGAVTYRLPFKDLLPPLSPDELAGLRASIEANGVLVPATVYDSDEHGGNCIIDGGHRATIAAELKIDLPTRRLKKITDEQALGHARGLNIHRRHFTPEQRQAIRAERVKRVAEKRKAGASLRDIADEEGVSEKQVREDLKASGAEGSAPEKVKGKDGKTYSSTRQVSSPQGDSDESKPATRHDEPVAGEPDADESDNRPECEACHGSGEDHDRHDPAKGVGYVHPCDECGGSGYADPAGGGESTGELAAGESAPAGQPLPLRDDEGNYLYPLDGSDDPDAPPADANWRLPDGSVERPGDLKVSPPDVMDDPAARVDRLRDRFKTLLKLLRTAGAELGELLTHHQAGRYLRRVTDDRGSSLFVERPRIIRSGKHEGGWHSPELSRLYDAVKQAAVDRLCVGCRGGGCDHCDGAGFFPAAADGAV